MYQYLNKTHIGPYQVVSDSRSDPFIMFQPLSVYQQSYPSSLQNHQYNPQYYQQYYTEFYSCQQQQFAHCQQYVSHQQYTDSACIAVICAANLSFIRDGLQQMILMTERIQGNLNNISGLLLQSTKTLQSLPSIPTSDPAPKSTIVDAPPAKGAEDEKAKMATTPAAKAEMAAQPTASVARKDTSMKKPPSKVATAQNIAEKSFVAYGSYILHMQKHAKNYTLLDVILKRSMNKLVRICVVVFDPGGMRGMTGMLWDVPLGVEASKSGDFSLIIVFKATLFPILQNIMAYKILEFWPYAFQIFAQLVDKRQPPLSDSYIQLLHELLLRSGNVLSLVRLLQAYLQKILKELNNEGRLTQILGICDRLVSVAIKHGHVVLVDSMNAVQVNIFVALVQQFWIPNLKLISGHIEVKLTSVASTKLIYESFFFVVSCP